MTRKQRTEQETILHFNRNHSMTLDQQKKEILSAHPGAIYVMCSYDVMTFVCFKK